MMRHLTSVLVLGLLVPAVLGAQAPAGWKIRIDRSTQASDPDGAGDVKFTKAGASGFHAVNPQAAVYWNPANTATGNYSLKATFTLLEPSNHNNYYGLVFGGNSLDAAAQSYLYFMVSQNGSWLLKQRSGENAPTVARGTSEAIKKPDASGKSVNVVEVHVLADKVDFLVNGTTVHSAPKTGQLATTNGIYGLRVNHFLNVQIDQLTLAKI
jgi:hypothetical protein